MKIALVWPKGFDTNYILPLALGYLKSNLDDKKHEIKIIDCAINNLNGDSQEFKKYISDFEPNVVGVTCWSVNYDEIIKILKTVKSIDENIIKVVGGCHATAFPESLMNDADFVFRGESELSFPLFLEELQKEDPRWEKINGLCRFNFFFLNSFQPLPATPVYDQLVKKGKIKEKLLPKDFSSGKTVYIPEGLEDVNFPMLRLKEYAYLAVSNPLNIPYMFKFGGYKMALKKICLNFKKSILGLTKNRIADDA